MTKIKTLVSGHLQTAKNIQNVQKRQKKLFLKITLQCNLHMMRNSR